MPRFPSPHAVAMRFVLVPLFAAAAALLAVCGAGPSAGGGDSAPADAAAYADGTPDLGARYNLAGDAITFRVYSSPATRVEVYLYAKPLGEDEKAHFAL